MEVKGLVKKAAKNAPVKKFSSGGISITAWENKTKDSDKSFLSFGIQKRYYDKEEETYKDSTSFSLNDLAIVEKLSAQMFAWAISALADAREE